MARTETRERILDSAERLFFGDGIGVTGVDRVAADAGVAIATLYQHVGSKETGDCWRWIRLENGRWVPEGPTKYTCSGVTKAD